MEHVLAKTILIAKVSELLSKESKIKLKEATSELYLSGFVDLINDDETGLYGESPLYVFSIYKKWKQQL